MDIIKVNAVDAAYMVDRYQCSRLQVFSRRCIPIAAPAIAKAHKNWRLGAFYRNIADIDILHHTSVYYLKRNRRRTNPLPEELLLLVFARFHYDPRDIYIAEPTVSLSTKFHGIAMRRYYTVGDTYILA